MDYFRTNEEAWEEAFEHRHPHWGDDNYQRLLDERLPFFVPDVQEQLQSMDFAGKRVGQFCCNNGRELLSLMQLGAKSGVGFDIAGNIIDQATLTAQKAGIGNCEFVRCNILDIPAQYDNSFDFIMLTIGAITWFQELEPLFKKVSDCLTKNGILLIHDFHPFMNMLPLPGEADYDENRPNKISHSYFRSEPWIENEGMGYMSEQYSSKTFTSFSHTMAGILNALTAVGMRVTKLNEYDYDVGLTDVYDGKGYPLSFLLLTEKM